MKKLSFRRYNDLFEPCSNGRKFTNKKETTSVVDLTAVRILDTSIDTVRQLYSGKLCPDALERLEIALSDGHRPIVDVLGQDFMLKRGGRSGYRFLLQNVEYGFVVHIKEGHTKAEREGTHCKIEVSPKAIRDQRPEALQQAMDDLAAEWFEVDPKPCGVAVHLAADWQGWEPPKDFVDRFTCRSRRISDRYGMNSLGIESGEVAAVYGRGQSFTFGSVNAIQAALYNKTEEVKAHDKADFFRQIWRNAKSEDLLDNPYNPDLPVWRFEIRFHQTVLRQFAQGNGVTLDSYTQVCEYLGNLWRYGLDRYRLDFDADYVDPMWTLLHDDAAPVPPVDSFVEKRCYKTRGEGNEKNLQLALGNLLSILARNNAKHKTAINCIKRSGMWADLIAYNKKRGLSEADLRDKIATTLRERRLTHKCAA